MKNNLTMSKKEIREILDFINLRIYHKLELTEPQKKFLQKYKDSIL